MTSFSLCVAGDVRRWSGKLGVDLLNTQRNLDTPFGVLMKPDGNPLYTFKRTHAQRMPQCIRSVASEHQTTATPNTRHVTTNSKLHEARRVHERWRVQRQTCTFAEPRIGFQSISETTNSEALLCPTDFCHLVACIASLQSHERCSCAL